MRIPGMGGEVMSRLGVTVQVLAGGDIYPALERGAIDATEWVGPYDDEKLGFHKVAEYYYYPGWWEPGPTLSFYVGTKAWKELPDDFKVIFETAARAAGMQMIERYDARNPEALGRLRKHGTKLAAFPDDVMAASRDASNALMQEYASKNPEFKAIYEPWDAFRQSISDWFSTAEQSYQAFAYRKG
jgi:TRAP-type mannitol/chloroaromatic compound transport system substrate-binding protein